MGDALNVRTTALKKSGGALLKNHDEIVQVYLNELEKFKNQCIERMKETEDAKNRLKALKTEYIEREETLRVEITESQRKEAVESSDFEMKQKSRDELLEMIQSLQASNREKEEKINGLTESNEALEKKVEELQPKEETFGAFIGGILGVTDEKEKEKEKKEEEKEEEGGIGAALAGLFGAKKEE